MSFNTTTAVLPSLANPNLEVLFHGKLYNIIISLIGSINKGQLGRKSDTGSRKSEHNIRKHAMKVHICNFTKSCNQSIQHAFDCDVLNVYQR